MILIIKFIMITIDTNVVMNASEKKPIFQIVAYSSLNLLSLVQSHSISGPLTAIVGILVVVIGVVDGNKMDMSLLFSFRLNNSLCFK